MKQPGMVRLTALLTALSLGVACLTACGGRKRTKNSEKVTLTVMSWNDQFREMMETYFIPRHPALMENVTIEWINDEIVGYRENVEERLNTGQQIDLFLGDDTMAPYFSANPYVASLKQLGIGQSELAQQYRFTRVLGSDEHGIQKGAAINAEPGILLYRADYAEKYLGITHQEEMQEKLSSWDSFISLAAAIQQNSDGKVKMLTSSAEAWYPIDCAMNGLWLKNGQLSVSDETVTHWLDIVKELNSANAFLDVKAFDDNWYDAVNSGVFCFFSAPWLNKSAAPDHADITTIFMTSRRNGMSFGKFKTSLAPGGFVYGGNWLYSSANSAHKEITGEIIRAFTCDSEFMRLIALGNLSFVNNRAVNEALSELHIANPLFDGLDAFSVYQNAADSLEFAVPSPYDREISRLLFNQTKAYCKGETTPAEAAYQFRLNVWKKYSDIAAEPEKPSAQNEGN